jgi:hypothetical protein
LELCGAATPFASGMQNNAATNWHREATVSRRFGAVRSAALWRVDHVSVCRCQTTDMPVAAVEFAAFVY